MAHQNLPGYVPLLLPFLMLCTMLQPAAWPSAAGDEAALGGGRISYSLHLWQQLFWVNVGYSRWSIQNVQEPAVALAFAFAAVIGELLRLRSRLSGWATSFSASRRAAATCGRVLIARTARTSLDCPVSRNWLGRC